MSQCLMCVCVCVHVRACVCVHACVHARVCVCVCVCVYVHVLLQCASVSSPAWSYRPPPIDQAWQPESLTVPPLPEEICDPNKQSLGSYAGQ